MNGQKVSRMAYLPNKANKAKGKLQGNRLKASQLVYFLP